MAGKYKTFDPKAEVIGYSMLGFSQCLRKEGIMPYLKLHKLADITPEGWYPLQSWLDVLSDLAETRQGEAMFDFVAVGMKVVETSPFPPGSESLSLPEAFEVAKQGYFAGYHRGGGVGEIVIETPTPKHLLLKYKTPYPDDFWYGVLYGMSRRFLPRGTHFTVYYDELEPRREQGGEWTVIHITWE